MGNCFIHLCFEKNLYIYKSGAVVTIFIFYTATPLAVQLYYNVSIYLSNVMNVLLGIGTLFVQTIYIYQEKYYKILILDLA